MKKILIIGSISFNSIELIWKNHFENSNVEVEIFNINEYFSYNIVNKLFIYFNIYIPFFSLNNKLKKFVNKKKYDFIVIFKGNEVLVSTIKEIKKNCNFLVNYNTDHPLIRYEFSHGAKNISESLFYYDIIVTYNHDLFVALLHRKYLAYHLPFCHDISDDKYQRIVMNNSQEVKAVCFIGNADDERVRIVNFISTNNIPIHVYGHNWDKYNLSANVLINEAIYFTEYHNLIRKYRIQLNLLRYHNFNSHNMRTFEIAACGGIQLATNSLEYDMYFKEHGSIFTFNNDSDLIEQINYIFSFTEQEVSTFRHAARNAVKNKYLYFTQLNDLSNYFNFCLMKKY